jgi:hypothetical protein
MLRRIGSNTAKSDALRLSGSDAADASVDAAFAVSDVSCLEVGAPEGRALCVALDVESVALENGVLAALVSALSVLGDAVGGDATNPDCCRAICEGECRSEEDGEELGGAAAAAPVTLAEAAA